MPEAAVQDDRTPRSAEGGATTASAAAWEALALGLPEAHRYMVAGRANLALAAFRRLPLLTRSDLAALAEAQLLRLGLDVFMVEAFLRRHGFLEDLDASDRRAVDAACDLLSAALDIPPILTYPLYILENPRQPGSLRRFTPLAAEARFINMHRRIEEEMAELLPLLEQLPIAPDPMAAVAAALPVLGAGFRRINRCMAAFRSQTRMPQEDFFHGFRPYYDSKKDADGGVLLEGPSGLQSAGYRLLAMRIGYRDASFDRWTDQLMHHQLPAARRALLAARRDRDAGRSLGGLVDGHLGSGQVMLPPLHPNYAPQLPELFEAALAGGYVSTDILATFANQGLALGRWPAGAPVPDWPADIAPLPAFDARQAAWVDGLKEIEAMIFGFQMEHAATAAVQIGTVQGTGGTSGVEFLLLATFRRAFPRLWARPSVA